MPHVICRLVFFLSRVQVESSGMATPSDNPVQDGEHTATATRPLILPEKFNPTGNFNEWISCFKGIAAISKWIEDDKSLWLKVQLTNKAHVALTRLPNDAHDSYTSLKAALKERFEPSSMRVCNNLSLARPSKHALRSY